MNNPLFATQVQKMDNHSLHIQWAESFVRSTSEGTVVPSTENLEILSLIVELESGDTWLSNRIVIGGLLKQLVGCHTHELGPRADVDHR